MALKAYSDMCQRISENSGRNGFAEGTNWLMKNFHTSCFGQFGSSILSHDPQGIKKVIKQKGIDCSVPFLKRRKI